MRVAVGGAGITHPGGSRIGGAAPYQPPRERQRPGADERGWAGMVRRGAPWRAYPTPWPPPGARRGGREGSWAVNERPEDRGWLRAHPADRGVAGPPEGGGVIHPSDGHLPRQQCRVQSRAADRHDQDNDCRHRDDDEAAPPNATDDGEVSLCRRQVPCRFAQSAHPLCHSRSLCGRRHAPALRERPLTSLRRIRGGLRWRWRGRRAASSR